MSNQIITEIHVDLDNRDKSTALFRLFLAVPVLIFLSSFSEFADDLPGVLGGLLFLPVVLSMLFRNVYPSYVLAFNKALLELSNRVNAYVLVLTDEYPSIEENDVVSVTFPEVDAKALNRWLPLVKWFLAIPLYLVGIAYIIYAAFLTLFAWFSILFTGNYPEFCAEGVVGTIAYWNRVAGYALVLVTDEYPTFSL